MSEYSEDEVDENVWYNRTWLVFFLCFLFFPVGLYGLYKNETATTCTKSIIITLFALFAYNQIFGNEEFDKLMTGMSTELNSPTQVVNKEISIGDPLQTDYFEITVNSVTIKDRVDTGNMFSSMEPEKDVKFLIINTTFKNIDVESRMIMDGSLWITYNGKKYEFDVSETILDDNWGVLLDRINPLLSKTTNIVYKIPAEISGLAYFRPGRAKSNEVIFLGNI
jgi:hypothetical protein